MASTCVWFPYPDSACLVLGCVRLPQRLSKGKCIGSILDDGERLRDAFYFNRQKSPPQRLACAWPLLSPEAARACGTPGKMPRPLQRARLESWYNLVAVAGMSKVAAWFIVLLWYGGIKVNCLPAAYPACFPICFILQKTANSTLFSTC